MLFCRGYTSENLASKGVHGAQITLLNLNQYGTMFGYTLTCPHHCLCSQRSTRAASSSSRPTIRSWYAFIAPSKHPCLADDVPVCCEQSAISENADKLQMGGEHFAQHLHNFAYHLSRLCNVPLVFPEISMMPEGLVKISQSLYESILPLVKYVPIATFFPCQLPDMCL